MKYDRAAELGRVAARSEKATLMPLFNSSLTIVRRAIIIDRFRGPLNAAAIHAARQHYSVGWRAVTMASVIHRAIEEEPNEVRPQYKKGDP
jgi:hypothetical protein